MRIAVDSAESALFRARNAIFFTAVIAMNYTLSRPSPVDLIFILAFLVTLFVKQEVTPKFVTLVLLLTSWAVAYFFASVPYLGEKNVAFELLAKSFAISLALIGAAVTMSFDERNFLTYMRVYIVSCVIASILGTVGFALRIGLLTWDDRAKGLIDDPNMYGSFLIPAALFCVHLMHRPGARRLWLAAALAIITVGILLSFSRIAPVAFTRLTGLYIVFLHRLHLGRLVPVLLGLVGFGLLLFAIAYFSSAEFSEKFLQRLTFAESYDLGREGRYGRYLLVLPMILDHPMGYGVLQLEKIFPEPIHNIWLSSFVNYGWLGGFTWIVLFFSSIGVCIQNYRKTRNPIPLVLMLSLIGIVMCASLHEGEHWRHMWLAYGLVWGFNAAKFMPEPPRRAAPVPVMEEGPRVFRVAGLARAGEG